MHAVWDKPRRPQSIYRTEPGSASGTTTHGSVPPARRDHNLSVKLNLVAMRSYTSLALFDGKTYCRLF